MRNNVSVEEGEYFSSEEDKVIEELTDGSKKKKTTKTGKQPTPIKSPIRKIIHNLFHNNEVWANVRKLGPLSEHFNTSKRHPVRMGGLLDAMNDTDHDAAKFFIGGEKKFSYFSRNFAVRNRLEFLTRNIQTNKLGKRNGSVIKR
jgi:hypothetical protein